ncbi:class II aldolase/adducin family protein [Streptomyces sp. NPDC006658]|uniref:class II aldolase/adducin family protein n=1 Tax=unclassified Streptomyces TaxID=2593676 RepID=UPI0033D74DC0
MRPVRTGTDVEPQRDLLAAAVRSLSRSGRLPGTSGSVSVASGEAVLITADGVRKETMTRHDTVLVDPFRGLPLLGETSWPCAETPVHLALYRRLPGCGAVIHVPAESVMTLNGLTTGPGRNGTDQAALGDDVFLPNRATPPLPTVVLPHGPGTAPTDGDALDGPCADAPPVLLVERGGAVVWGRDVAEARDRLERAAELGHARPPRGPGSQEPAPGNQS